MQSNTNIIWIIVLLIVLLGVAYVATMDKKADTQDGLQLNTGLMLDSGNSDR